MKKLTIVTLKTTAYIGAALFVGGAMIAGLLTSVTKGEKVDCYKWQRYSKEFSREFYLLEWQKQQCDRHGIDIDAPVKTGKELE